MAESELCWKCKDIIIGLFGVRSPLTPLGIREISETFHCHHDPKEKPKCWCVAHKKFGGMNAYLETSVVKLNFCPECGEKLYVIHI